MRRSLALLGALCAIAVVLVSAPTGAGAEATATPPGDDAVVVAIIDSAFVPYHYDFQASQMPQAKNADPSDDLPLDQPANTWLSGFSQANMASFDKLQLTPPSGPNDDPAALAAQDSAKWASVQSSDNSKSAHVYWMPGTKVIAAATFGGSLNGTTADHGNGTSSVSVGNLHGSCPECLAVLLSGDYEQAINWAMRQPWIDAITNSYGISTAVAVRDRVYNGCSLTLQKQAVERGQGIFFSAGNGVENAFTVPNSTLFSCQEGPDWLITVGAINSVDIVYVGTDSISTFTNEPGGTPGSGRPADIASIGDSYPSAYEATTVSGSGAIGFSGTSNATPVVAGEYAHALWEARRDLAGASRGQSGGVIATGVAACGSARPACEIGDGKLSHGELRTALYNAARPTIGVSPGGLVTVQDTADLRYNAQGHGGLVGRIFGDAIWTAERERISGTVFGRRAADVKDPASLTDAAALSYCSQHLWGAWGGGAWHPGQALPAIAAKWPTRAVLTNPCSKLSAPPREPYVSLYGDPNA
jgi:hypothetical protein